MNIIPSCSLLNGVNVVNEVNKAKSKHWTHGSIPVIKVALTW